MSSGRMIPPVSRRSTRPPSRRSRFGASHRSSSAIGPSGGGNSQNTRSENGSLRVLRALRCTSFVADVANDPSWLALRLESIPGPFADRVVFWVDGREIRPDSVEFRPFDSPRLAQGRPADALSTYRLRGHMPMDARTLRWFYGLVIDPYPLTIRRADGRMIVEEVQGDAWSRTIDLSGQFHAPLLSERVLGMLIAALLLLPVAIRYVTRRRINTKDSRDTKEIRCTA